jgi:hypothetical protein
MPSALPFVDISLCGTRTEHNEVENNQAPSQFKLAASLFQLNYEEQFLI